MAVSINKLVPVRCPGHVMRHNVGQAPGRPSRQWHGPNSLFWFSARVRSHEQLRAVMRDLARLTISERSRNCRHLAREFAAVIARVLGQHRTCFAYGVMSDLDSAHDIT